MEFYEENVLGLLNKESLPTPQILLIEDCQSDSVLIKHILNDYYPNAIVDNAMNKSQSIRYLAANKYDLILMDLNLPDSIGLKDVGEIRAKSRNAPMIITTSHCNKETIAAAKKYGAEGILGKDELIGISFPISIEKATKKLLRA